MEWHRGCFHLFHQLKQMKRVYEKDTVRTEIHTSDDHWWLLCQFAKCSLNLMSRLQQAWGLSMQEKFRRIQVPLVIVICFFILALPAYHRCTNFPGTKFTPSGLFFENPDQEYGLPDCGKSELKTFGTTALFTIFLPGTGPSEQSSHLFSRSLSLRQETPVLRC
jgi:hypothetical protein